MAAASDLPHAVCVELARAAVADGAQAYAEPAAVERALQFRRTLLSPVINATGVWVDDLRRLDDAQALLAARPESGRRSSSCELLVSRDQRVLRILLDVPSAGEGDASVQLAVDGAASAKVRTLRQGWLGG